MSEIAVLDRVRFEEVTGGDPELERELAELYLTTAEKYLAEMSTILGRDGDWSGPAHALKGASANLGISEMQELAKKAEYSEPDPALMEQIRTGLARVRDLFVERNKALRAN
ncbi:MAG: Hpt domain-containing protein [Geminicoccaceae bacterium]